MVPRVSLLDLHSFIAKTNPASVANWKTGQQH